MNLEIVLHAHPALRTKGKTIANIDQKLVDLADDMIDTMIDAEGVGLAAQQVGLPLQMFVLDVPKSKDRPSTMKIDGKLIDFAALMPMVLINPVIETFGRARFESEGCLSFPGIRADILRPYGVRISATQIDGEKISFEADGLLARAIQHEYDHLQGILFIDRIEAEERLEVLPDDIQRLVRPVTT